MWNEFLCHDNLYSWIYIYMYTITWTFLSAEIFDFCSSIIYTKSVVQPNRKNTFNSYQLSHFTTGIKCLPPYLIPPERVQIQNDKCTLYNTT